MDHDGTIQTFLNFDSGQMGPLKLRVALSWVQKIGPASKSDLVIGEWRTMTSQNRNA